MHRTYITWKLKSVNKKELEGWDGGRKKQRGTGSQNRKVCDILE